MGAYLSERRWGTVREDYSAEGNAWDYFTHDQARSRAYAYDKRLYDRLRDGREHLFAGLDYQDKLARFRNSSGDGETVHRIRASAMSACRFQCWRDSRCDSRI